MAFSLNLRCWYNQLLPLPVLNILHITPWLPTPQDPTRALFIARHIASLEPFAPQHVLHVEWENRQVPVKDNITTVSAFSHIRLWRWREWYYYRILKQKLRQLDARNCFTHAVIHVGYPTLVFFEKLKHLLPEKICIVEHWSGYKLKLMRQHSPHRLARIFCHGLPLACVSHSLGLDICAFAHRNIPFIVIPNAVDNAFSCKTLKPGEHLLMAAHWKWPKQPLPIIQAIAALRQNGHEVRLRIAGGGPLLAEMQYWVTREQLEKQIVFLGVLTPDKLAAEMNNARAFIMPSAYETFSVGCAEALCCGCPVLASDTGALTYLIHDGNGLLHRADENWEESILRISDARFDRQTIAQEASCKYNENVVGKKLFAFISSI